MSEREPTSGSDRSVPTDHAVEAPASVDDGRVSAESADGDAGAGTEPHAAVVAAAAPADGSAESTEAGARPKSERPLEAQPDVVVSRAERDPRVSDRAPAAEGPAVGEPALGAETVEPPADAAIAALELELARAQASGDHPVRQIVTRAVWMTGALIWAYTVLGEFIYQGDDFPEGVAVISLLVALAVPWFRSVRNLPRDKRWRVVTIGSGTAAIALWLVLIVLIAILFGTSRRGDYATITLLVWLLGLTLYFVGRWLTRLPAPPKSKWRRLRSVLAWIVVGVATFSAGTMVIDDL